MNTQEQTQAIEGMVEEFWTVMGQNPGVHLQATIAKEEADELIKAAIVLDHDRTEEAMAEFLKEAADLTYTLAGLSLTIEDEDEDVARSDLMSVEHFFEALDAAAMFMMSAHDFFMNDDLLYEVITRVHTSNMSKVDETGVPVRDDNGKILKGPNYVAPDLSDLAGGALNDFIGEIEDQAEAA